MDETDYKMQADFRYAMRCFSRFSEIQARKEGITPQQHLVLLMIRGHPSYPEVSIGDVAERMQVKHHSASLLVERTVQRGLLSRETDANDRRRALCCLTTMGQEILDRITQANRGEMSELGDQLFSTSLIDLVRGSDAPWTP